MHWKALEHWRRLHLNLHHPKIRKNIMNNLPASNNVLLFSSFIMALISWRFHMNLAFILICNAYMLKVCYKVNSIIDLNTSGTLNTIPDHRNGICEQYWQLTNSPPVSLWSAARYRWMLCILTTYKSSTVLLVVLLG